MTTKKINARLSISYPNTDCVSIRLHDEESGIEFFDADISHEEFSRALSSLSQRPFLHAEVRGSEYLGKRRITEPRTAPVPDSYDREFLTQYVKDNMQEDGWILNAYLGSQNSIYRENGQTMARYSVTRYEDVE